MWYESEDQIKQFRRGKLGKVSNKNSSKYEITNVKNINGFTVSSPQSAISKTILRKNDPNVGKI